MKEGCGYAASLFFLHYHAGLALFGMKTNVLTSGMVASPIHLEAGGCIPAQPAHSASADQPAERTFARPSDKQTNGHQRDLISHNTAFRVSYVRCTILKVMNILCTFAGVPDDLCQTAFWENVKHRERSRIICNKNQCINRNHIGKTNSF